MAASEQRTVDRHIKLTPAEDDRLKAAAAAESTTVSEWARRKLLLLIPPRRPGEIDSGLLWMYPHCCPDVVNSCDFVPTCCSFVPFPQKRGPRMRFWAVWVGWQWSGLG